MKIIGIMNELYNNNKLENKRFKTPDGMILDNVSDLLKYVGVLNDEWFSLNDIIDSLNDEIEIIEEVEDKEYEDIGELCYNIKEFENDVVKLEYENKTMRIGRVIVDLSTKIDALIRNQKYILERINRGE